MRTIEELMSEIDNDELSAIWLVLLSLKNSIDELSTEVERITYELECVNTGGYDYLTEQ